MTDEFTKAQFVAWGREGGKKGGKARARALSAAKRQKIASIAGKARWAKQRAKNGG